MSFFGRFGALLGVIAIAVFLAGCGETLIDSSKTADALKQNLEKSLGKKVSSVECPSDQKVEAGATFTCNVKLSDGKQETATLKIRNEDADVSVIKLSGGNE